MLLSFGWKLLASSLLDTVYSNLRSLIIGKKYSSEDLAYFNRGNELPAVVTDNIISSIDSVLLPAMSKVQNDPEQVKNMTTAGASKDPEVEKKVLESMEKLYEVNFVDPISLSDKIQALEKEIQDFNTNVDFALSESNSTTFIDVDD